MKRLFFAILAVFVTWAVLDYLLHSVLLRTEYEATANLWRPMAEIKNGLLIFVTLISAFVFVAIYERFFANRGVGTGIRYGLLFGLGAGISMAYGSYAVMPIPYSMAVTLFFGTLVETTLGGLVLGLIIRD